jgi:hypothetical protein
MKSKKIVIGAGLLLASLFAAAQTNMISSGSDMMTFAHSDLDYINNKNDRYATIEGTPYLDEEFHTGSVSFKNKKYTGMELRFNPYEGYFEFKTDEGIKFLDPRTTRIDTVWLEDNTYEYINYQSGKSLKQNFMKIAHSGTTSVYLYDEMILSQPEEASGYDAAKPARFEQMAESIYIRKGGDSAKEFKGKKSLEEIFPEYHKQLAAYVKSEKLKLKKTEDVVSLCSYYDSLH